jgi:CRP-like cAMP-binding protein
MLDTYSDHPLFFLLVEQEMKELTSISRIQEYMAHETIIRIGERNRDVLCIKEGSVSVQIEDTNAVITEIARLHEGSLIGEMNFIIPSRRTANVVALTEVQAEIFPYADFCALLEKNPELAAKIFHALNLQLTAKYLNMLFTL